MNHQQIKTISVEKHARVHISLVLLDQATAQLIEINFLARFAHERILEKLLRLTEAVIGAQGLQVVPQDLANFTFITENAIALARSALKKSTECTNATLYLPDI